MLLAASVLLVLAFVAQHTGTCQESLGAPRLVLPSSSPRAPLPLSGVSEALQSRLARIPLQGAASCSASACHNRPGSTGTYGREYAVALDRDTSTRRLCYKDRHAGAYDVLFDPLARRIEQALHPEARSPRPQTDSLCLRCHVHPAFDTQPMQQRAGATLFRLEDGVSCEACHGPAGQWLAAHFRDGWTTLPAAERLALGQYDTRSLPGRIRLCVDCHVGAADMDVNHDLIAAGHPRLNFEFTGFQTAMHKHWDDAADRARVPDFEGRGWVLGQVIAARASLALLADRAEAAVHDPRRPWPEFAEYDCFACHHDLRPNGVRPSSGSSERKAGTLPMSRWYVSLLPDALRGLGVAYDAPVQQALADVRKAMEANRPDRRQVAASARRAVSILDQRLAEARGGPATPLPVDVLLHQVLHDARRPSTPSWDEGAQAYLAIRALRRARADMGLPLRSAPDLPKLRELLQFPPGFASPARFDPVELRKTLDALEGSQPR